MPNLYQGCGINISGKGDLAKLAELENTGQYIAEPKLDGNWAECHITRNGMQFFSRPGNALKSDLETYLSESLRPGTIVIGELARGTQASKDRVELAGHAILDVFDIVKLDGQSVRSRGDNDRRKILEAWHRTLDAETVKRFPLVQRFKDGFVEQYHAQPEGLVLKRAGHQPYTGCGSKVEHWIKCKRHLTVDLKALDFIFSKTSRGKRKLKSIVCGSESTPMIILSHMPGHVRKSILNDPDTFQGRILEIQHLGQFKSGKFRNPTFIRWRDDKLETDYSAAAIKARKDAAKEETTKKEMTWEEIFKGCDVLNMAINPAWLLLAGCIVLELGAQPGIAWYVYSIIIFLVWLVNIPDKDKVK